MMRCSLLSTISLSALLFAQAVTLPAFADETLRGRVETNWRYGNERSILMTEFWVPFAQDHNSVLYGDVRLMGDNQENREGNLGVGYRKLVTGPFADKGIIGVNGWMDRRITSHGSTFHQFATGLEWLGESIDLRMNAYLPLSDAREFTIANPDPQAPGFTGTGIVVDTQTSRLLEEPQRGFDLELGWNVGQHFDVTEKNLDSLRLYGGVYGFDGKHTDSVTGWRTRLAADITENIQLGARFQHDNERGSQGFLEATFRFPFDSKSSYREQGLRSRLDEAPERDIDIVTGDVVTDSGDRVQVINKATGQAQKVIHVDNTASAGGNGSAEKPFNTLAAAQAAAQEHNVIYVHRGDGTTAGQNAGITLNKKGLQLIGSGTNFVYDSGRFTTANNSSPSSLLIAPATTAPVITNAGNKVTVAANDITIAGLKIDGGVGSGISMQPSIGQTLSGIDISDVVVSNIGTFGLNFAAGNSNSAIENVTVRNTTLSDNSSGNVRLFPNTGGRIANMEFDQVNSSGSFFGYLIFGNADMSNIRFLNNTVTDADYGFLIMATQGGHKNQISFSNNTVTGNNSGIEIYDYSFGSDLDVDLGGGSTGSIGRNSLYGNTTADLTVELYGAELKAENNWWGNPAGLQAGQATIWNGSIDADPFLTSAP